MPQYGWDNAPQRVRRQVLALVTGLQEALGDELVGVYLHGSLAMGCFNPQRSDLDVLALTHGRLVPEARPRLARLLLRASGVPNGIEISVLNQADLYPWHHPAPYEFHYSEDWRDRTQARLDHCFWPEVEAPPTDPDLAAHVTLARARGVTLWGQPVADALPEVPPADYADSILEDFHWGRDLLGVNPVYFVLNTCRVRAFLEQGLLVSKDEGGEWGLRHLPARHRPVIRQALRLYRGELAGDAWAEGAVEAFADEMAKSMVLH
jgi:predicted nucleotidyltransferase